MCSSVCCPIRRFRTSRRSSATVGSISIMPDVELSENYARFQARGKREAIFGGGGETEPEYEEKRDTEKTEAEITFIDNCCKSEMLFTGLDEDQRMAIIKQMYRVECKAGTQIIEQGDKKANIFYLIQEGSFKIFVNETEVAHYGAGKCFGELALMYDAPRAATVQADEDSKLFAVHRLAFRSALRKMVKEQGSRNQNFLGSISEFRNLPAKDLALVDMALQPLSFNQGETILSQGEVGDRFYLIISGMCTWTKSLPSGGIETGDLTMGQYFGERALIKNEMRAATIVAKTPCKTLTLSKEDFNEIIDNEIFRSRLLSYERGQEPIIEEQEEEHSRKTDTMRELSGAETSTSVRRTVCALEILVKNTVGVLGKGAFGIVTLVLDPMTQNNYALKAIKKCQIVEQRQQNHIVNEMFIMRRLAEGMSPFLVNLITTYKDALRVYFLLEACLGGELFTILRKCKHFSEKTARFYIACVTEAFDFMHRQNIIYRDLKPENLVLDSEGYLKVTDFGFAKEVIDKTFTLCGTPDYLAPEIVTGQGHGRAVDWWTLGVLLYEMVASFPPFYDDIPINTYRKIIKGRIRFPPIMSLELRNIIKAFLKVRAIKRLGMQHEGTDVVRRDPFFSGFKWTSLQQKSMKAPIRNNVKSRSDLSHFKEISIEADHATPVSKEDDFDDYF